MGREIEREKERTGEGGRLFDLVFTDELLEAGFQDGAEAPATARVDEGNERRLGRVVMHRSVEPRVARAPPLAVTVTVAVVQRECPRGGISSAHGGVHGGAEAPRERGPRPEILLLEPGRGSAAEAAPAE